MTKIILLILTVFFFTSCSHTDQYGGNTALTFPATGWFHTAEKNGRQYFVTPEGNAYIAIGANHISKFLQRKGSEEFIANNGGDLPSACSAMRCKLGDLHLNAGEAYSADFEEFRDLPYIANIHYPFGGKFGFDVFDKETMSKLASSFTEEAQKFANDKRILGITLIDLPIWDTRRVNFYRDLKLASAGKQAYLKFIQKNYASIEQLNKAYGTAFDSYNAISSKGISKKNLITKKDDDAFLGLVAEEFYRMARVAVKTGAPNHMFFGERYVLRMYPDEVIKVVGKYVDVFCTQALILSPQRPPEWQYFQEDGYDHEYSLTKKPMIVIDWAAPFSTGESYDNWNGFIKNEKEASDDAAKWLTDAFQKPYMIGVFKCQLIGYHGNDKRFPKGKMKRTYLQDDGSSFEYRTKKTIEAHKQVLDTVYK